MIPVAKTATKATRSGHWCLFPSGGILLTGSPYFKGSVRAPSFLIFAGAEGRRLRIAPYSGAANMVHSTRPAMSLAMLDGDCKVQWTSTDDRGQCCGATAGQGA